MAKDYTATRSTAARLIAKFGDDALLVTTETSQESFPGAGDGSTEETEAPVKAVLVEYSVREREGGSIATGDRKALVSAGSGVPIPTTGMKLRYRPGPFDYQIKDVSVLRPAGPGGVAVMFELQVRAERTVGTVYTASPRITAPASVSAATVARFLADARVSAPASVSASARLTAKSSASISAPAVVRASTILTPEWLAPIISDLGGERPPAAFNFAQDDYLAGANLARLESAPYAFERAGSWYVIGAGLFGTNTPRIIPGTGARLTAGRSNLEPNSEVYSGTNWALGTSGGTPPSRLSDTTLLGRSASVWNVPTDGASQFAYRSYTGKTPGQEYTASWNVELGTATVAVAIIYDETNASFLIGAGDAAARVTNQLDGNGRGRVFQTFTAPAGCTAFRAYPIRRDGQIAGGGTVTLGAFQLSEGGPCDYIPTAGSIQATGDDEMTFDMAALGLSNDQEFTAVFDDDSTATLNASAGTLTMPLSAKDYRLIYAMPS